MNRFYTRNVNAPTYLWTKLTSRDWRHIHFVRHWQELSNGSCTRQTCRHLGATPCPLHALDCKSLCHGRLRNGCSPTFSNIGRIVLMLGRSVSAQINLYDGRGGSLDMMPLSAYTSCWIIYCQWRHSVFIKSVSANITNNWLGIYFCHHADR